MNGSELDPRIDRDNNKEVLLFVSDKSDYLRFYDVDHHNYLMDRFNQDLSLAMRENSILETKEL